MPQLGLLVLAFGGIPAAMLAWQVRLIALAGIPAVAIGWYMLGMGSGLAGWTLRECLDGLQRKVIRIDDVGRTIIESKACYSGDDVFFLVTGLGMVLAGLVVAIAFIADRSAKRRRVLLAVAGLLSASGIGYAISPVGLVVVALSPPVLLLIAAKRWPLRPRSGNATLAGHR